tara:strand:- start:446 stop:1378 length:933 start_codon:yes stop_codon:yes gene_type:complete
MARPFVSIVMPAYNCGETITASIASVQSQTCADWELIIIDDGSSDQTADLVRALAREDSRLRLFTQPNSGPSRARNNGIRLANGQYVAFLDADDLWAPERLRGMLNAFDANPAAGVLFSRVRFVDETGSECGRLSDHVSQLTAGHLLGENPVCSTSNIICKAEVLSWVGYFSPDLNFAEDQEWLLRVALDGKWTICGVDREWLFYRTRPDSQSTDLKAMRSGWMTMVQRAHRFGELSPDTIRHAYGPFHRYLARRALRMGKPVSAAGFLAQACLTDPGLIIREPRRTLLTALGAAALFIPSTTIRELVAK